jgi:hypothetical protein
MKNATVDDARPVSPKDCDYVVWTRSIHRAVFDYFRKVVCPQQLWIEVSSGVELKYVVAQILFEDLFASGRGGALAKDFRINAHSRFDNRSRVLTSREFAKRGEPSAALYALTSDFFVRQHASVYTRPNTIVSIRPSCSYI